jgi:hypothetical protein
VLSVEMNVCVYVCVYIYITGFREPASKFVAEAALQDVMLSKLVDNGQ